VWFKYGFSHCEDPAIFREEIKQVLCATSAGNFFEDNDHAAVQIAIVIPGRSEYLKKLQGCVLNFLGN
jgi:hypothetical protein